MSVMTGSGLQTMFCRQISLLTAVPLVLVLMLTGTASPAAAATSDPAPHDPFSPSSVWNAPIPNNAPLVSNSSTLVANLVQQVQTYGAWINSRKYSTPVYSVPANQPTVSVTIDHATAMYANATDAANLAQQLSAVPIPPNAQPAPGTDHHMVIWQPSTNTEWEMWLVSQETTSTGATRWHAGWGARIQNVSLSSGIAPHPFGATASGVSELGGLMTANEITGASITHALALTIPNAYGWGRFVWPANRTDGRSTDSATPMEGTRFRLDPKLNVYSLGLPPVAQAMALAAQRYGIVLRDTGGAVVFYAEQPSDVGLYDYHWGNGLDPAQMLAHFPWSRLQAIAPPTGSKTGNTPHRRGSRRRGGRPRCNRSLTVRRRTWPHRLPCPP